MTFEAVIDEGGRRIAYVEVEADDAREAYELALQKLEPGDELRGLRELPVDEDDRADERDVLAVELEVDDEAERAA